MDLRFGWATEYARQKFDVQVDDKTDLPQILAEAGISEALASQVTFMEKFQILETTGRFLAEAESVRVLPKGDEQLAAAARADAAKTQRQALLTAIRTRLGLEKPSEPAPAGE